MTLPKKKKKMQSNSIVFTPLISFYGVLSWYPVLSLLNEESAMRQIVCTCKYVLQKMTKSTISKTKWCSRLCVQGFLKLFAKPQIGFQCVTAERCQRNSSSATGRNEVMEGIRQRQKRGSYLQPEVNNCETAGITRTLNADILENSNEFGVTYYETKTQE